MFWNAHVHSEFSQLDGMGSVERLVEKASNMGQPALALTDHGNMSGVFQLYKHCKKRDMIPFPGVEAYVVDDIAALKEKGKVTRNQRTHLTMLSYTTAGYQNLVRLVSDSHKRENYHHKPLMDLSMLLQAKKEKRTDGIAILSGCYFGACLQSFVTAETADEGRLAVETHLNFYKAVFPHVVVELQNHNVQQGGLHESELVAALDEIATGMMLPVAITNDCHYTLLKDRHKHSMMKSIAYRSDASEVAFPGDGYHLANEQWIERHHDPAIKRRSEDGLAELIDINTISLPMLDNYSYRVPKLAHSPITQLRKRCDKRLQRKVGVHSPKWQQYHDRMYEELSVIFDTGMADYFLMVHDYVEFCEREGILCMARGSAAGSLICWLLDITWTDPIKWRLSFDRFLTKDRERPPDIDLDVEDHRRQEIVDYLADKYELVHIGTYNRLSTNAEGQGSLFRQYMASRRAIVGDKFPRLFGSIQDVDDLALRYPDDAEALVALNGESIYRSPGVHAAGIVVKEKGSPVTDWLPTMLIPSSGKTATQMMMDDVEDAGYVKIDLLGLRSLSTLHAALQNAGITDVNSIPLDSSRVFRLLREGRMNTGVFQMEGYTASKGCKDIGVRSIDDMIVVNALYRPAVLQEGLEQDYIRNRREPARIKYPSGIFRTYLKETYGVPIFQDTVLDILRAYGMDSGRMNKFLKAIKATDNKSAEFEQNRIEFFDLASAKGLKDKRRQEDAWALIMAFANYGFNRAHSTAYSLLGYYLAWLKIHYQVEFHAALLETAGETDKGPLYLAEARRLSVPIKPVCVNRSGVNWRLDGDGVRSGLRNIKGIGQKAADEITEHQPFSSVEDLLERCNRRAVTGGADWGKGNALKGVMLALQQAGALRSLGVRKA